MVPRSSRHIPSQGKIEEERTVSGEKHCTLKSTSGRWVLVATVLASGAVFLAGSAVPVALPAIQASFHTAFNGIQWVVNANLLSLGALILIGGALGDEFGRKRIFTLGMGLFGAAALLSGFAPSIWILLGLQALQGAGAALMVPQSLAIINDCFAESERGRAIGLWAGISSGIAALGPLAGGWLVDKFFWGAVFFMIVPVILAALFITILFVPGIAPSESRRLDWPGAITILIGLFGLIYGLMTGRGADWTSPVVVISLAIGVLAIGLFVFIEAREKQPLVYLRIFRNPLVTGANAVTLLLYFGLNGVIFFTVLNLQQIRDYSPTEAGLALLPPIGLITFFTWPTGALADRIGPRLQMILGPLFVSAGMLLLATGGLNADYLRHFLPELALFGAGMAMVIPPLTKCALSVEPRFSGSASGINNGIAQVAGLLAVAVLGIMVITLFHTRLNAELGQSMLTANEQRQILTQADKLGGIVIPDNFSEAGRQEAQQAIHSAFLYGFRRAMAACAALAFGGATVSAVLIRDKTTT
jgi:EmrB/QacA subfamily drug resistance transporter